MNFNGGTYRSFRIRIDSLALGTIQLSCTRTPSKCCNMRLDHESISVRGSGILRKDAWLTLTLLANEE